MTLGAELNEMRELKSVSRMKLKKAMTMHILIESFPY